MYFLFRWNQWNICCLADAKMSLCSIPVLSTFILCICTAIPILYKFLWTSTVKFVLFLLLFFSFFVLLIIFFYLVDKICRNFPNIFYVRSNFLCIFSYYQLYFICNLTECVDCLMYGSTVIYRYIRIYMHRYMSEEIASYVDNIVLIFRKFPYNLKQN